jgi:hypothetical protein
MSIKISQLFKFRFGNPGIHMPPLNDKRIKNQKEQIEIFFCSSIYSASQSIIL